MCVCVATYTLIIIYRGCNNLFTYPDIIKTYEKD